MSNVLREGVRLFVCGFSTDNVFFFLNLFSLWKHLRTEITPDFQLTKLQWGKSKVGIKMVKINNSRRGDSNTHPQHVNLWRTVCN